MIVDRCVNGRAGICRRMALLALVVVLSAASSAAPAQSNAQKKRARADTLTPAPTASQAEQAIRQAAAFEQKQDFKSAEALLRGALRADPGNAAVLYRLGGLLRNDGQYDEAVAAFEDLRKLQPGNSGLDMEIGKTLLWKADRTGRESCRREAIRSFEKRLAALPDDCEALKEIGAAYLRMASSDTACMVLKMARAKCPGHLEAARLLGETFMKMGEFDSAAATLSAIVRRHPGDPEFRSKLAECLDLAGREAAAEKEYRTVLVSTPYHTGAQVGIARIAARKGDVDEAGRRYQSAQLCASVQDPGPLIGLGDVASMRADWRTAVECYRGALAADPANDQVESHLRQAQWKIGPALNSELSSFETAQGLSMAWMGGTGEMDMGKSGTLSLGYRRWRLRQAPAPDLSRDDLSLSWGIRLTQRIQARLDGTRYAFSKNPGDGGSLYGWAANFLVTPFTSTNVYLGYSRIPAMESYATINAKYYQDVISAGLDQALPWNLSLQLSGFVAQFHGSMAFGYWSTVQSRWMTLQFMPDRSRHQNLDAQVSWQLLDSPLLFLRAGFTVLKTSRFVYLPYWDPLTFPYTRLGISLIRGNSGLFDYDLEARATHVDGGAGWGYGLSASWTVRLWNFVEVGASGGIERVGTDVPWDGKRFGALVRLHYSQW